MVVERTILQCSELQRMPLLVVGLLCFFMVATCAAPASPEENSGLRSGNDEFFEGDLRLTERQMELSRARAAIKSNLWPRGQLVYYIDNSLAKEPKAMAVIKNAMKEWEQKTCIRFVNRKSEPSYVLFFKGSGCWSYVGRTGQIQKLSLAPGCWHHGIVIHEIGHALGFFHEQSRPDRDEYVIIEWENIIEGSKHNFKKYSREQLDSLGTPYDYGSIMHYGSRYFSKNGKPTILSRKPGVVLGQRRGLSPIDALQMKLLYKCVRESDPFCNFDSNLCGWTQTNAAVFSWTWNSGKTPSRNTGPPGDHSGKGKYMYIETSYPRKQGDFAMLSFKGAHSGSSCMKFYYHMHGSGIGSLNVYNNGEMVWSRSGEQGNTWLEAQVTLTGDYYLVIEGVRGQTFTGDIAIDDISVSPGKPCEPATPSPVAPTTAPREGCGISPAVRVIGGVDAEPGSWPWQIGLHRDGRFICGGSLIKPTWVVTAAHCVTNKNPEAYFVRLGDHNREEDEQSEQDIGVVRIISHENYNIPRLSNDIALIQLEEPAILGARVGLVCLPKQDFQVPEGAECYITGWGKIEHPGNAHNILQQAPMPPIGQEECRNKNPFDIEITDQMLCAGKKGSIVSGCHGDSGGPYVCKNGADRWVLQGDVSWGSGSCSSQQMFTVFARVAKFRDWIEQHIGVASSPPPTTQRLRTTTVSPASPTTQGLSTVSPPPPTTGRPVIAKCGRRPRSRIVGGVQAPINAWPWQVMLRRRFGSQFCGASLINDVWVVTAAHCIRGMSAQNSYVRLGAHYKDRVSIGTEQDVNIAKIIPHPKYHSPKQYSNDVALLKLAQPAKLGKGIGFVCLPDLSVKLPLDGSKKCWITGWGTLQSGGAQPDVLMEATVPLVSPVKCSAAYPGQISNSMLCAGLDQGGVDACQGDSGGPLVCEFNHVWYLEGATSWGYGCAKPNKYGVYAKIREVKDWLETTMAAN